MTRSTSPPFNQRVKVGTTPLTLTAQNTRPHTEGDVTPYELPLRVLTEHVVTPQPADGPAPEHHFPLFFLHARERQATVDSRRCSPVAALSG